MPDAESRVIECCRALLTEQTEGSQRRLATEALAAYDALNSAGVDHFFDLLASEFPRRELFLRLNPGFGGTTALVEMRGRLLRGLAGHPLWAPVETDLASLLRVWFDVRFLEFRRIDSQTSPAVLESLIKYEAVHRIQDWRDLRRRLAADRRCFGLFHPALPEEPIVFMELALTPRVSTKVQPLLDPAAPVMNLTNCRCAVFYSISSCHEGLRGVPFGNPLIRQAVVALQREFPRLNTFATISPVPGFRPWLTSIARDGVRTNAKIASLIAKLKASNWFDDPAASRELEPALLPLCAFYLLHVKRGQEPADAVARFHLGNGARLERLNWLSDTSAAGLDRSAGVTANYLYRLPELDDNQRRFLTEGTVAASPHLRALARSGITAAAR